MRFSTHFLSHLIGTSTQFIVGLLVARQLAPEGTGNLAILQSLCLLVTPLILFGIQGPLIRELNKNFDPQLIRTANFMAWTTSLLSFLLLLPAAWLAPAQIQPLAPLCFFLYCLGEGYELKASRLYLLKHNLEAEIRLSNYSLLACGLLKALCAFSLPQYAIIPALFACSSLHCFLLRWKNSHLLPLPSSSKPSRKILSQLISQNWLASLPQILGQISKCSSPLILAASHGSVAVGILAITLKHSVFFTIGGKMLQERYFNSQTGKLGFKYAMLATLPTLATLPLIPLLYGSPFKDAAFWSACFLPLHILSLVNLGQIQNLHARNLSQKAAAYGSLGHLSCILLNLLLIPYWGILGVAVASTLGVAVQVLSRPSPKLPIDSPRNPTTITS